MLAKLVEAKYLRDHVLWLRFSDGAEGEVDFGEELWGEIFEPLRDERRFAEARLDEELGTVTWPNGADFAPEYLYQRVSPDNTLESTATRGV